MPDRYGADAVASDDESVLARRTVTEVEVTVTSCLCRDAELGNADSRSCDRRAGGVQYLT